MSRTIRIAGAGIAGLTAAINLRRAGRRVRVFEQRAEVGARFDGDFQGIENWSTAEDALDFLKRLGIPPEFPFKPGLAATAFDAFGTRYHYKSAEPVLYLVRRGVEPDSLDQYLKRLALDAGVEIVFHTKLDPHHADIIATGPGRPLILLHGIAFRTNLEDTIEILFDHHLAPGFYSYLIAMDGRGIICSARTRPSRGGVPDLQATIARFRELLNFDMAEERHFSNCGGSHPILNHRQIIVGEAAGFQDCLWGFGMRYAFHSGYLAAVAIAEERSYWDMARRELGPFLRTALVNRMLADMAGDVGYWILLNGMRWYGRLREFLRYHYRPRLWKSSLFPIAAAHVLPQFRKGVKLKTLHDSPDGATHGHCLRRGPCAP